MDRYYTPPDLAYELLNALFLAIPGGTVGFRILDPCAGHGAFSKAAWPALGPPQVVVTWDLDPEASAADETRDALAGPWDDAFDIVIGNPPYLKTEGFIEMGLARARHVAYLLPVNILSGAGRINRLHSRGHLRHVWMISPRPAFTTPEGETPGTASTEYCFCWWDREHVGTASLSWLRWRP
jgi:hypothetical protein